MLFACCKISGDRTSIETFRNVYVINAKDNDSRRICKCKLRVVSF